MKRLLFLILFVPALSSAAILKETTWYMRVGGTETNCGGYDGFNYPGGTNYADQDTYQLSLADLATSGAVTTLTSVTGGFTAAMVGNCIRISTGTNFTPGYYFVTTYTDANTVVLDRTPATAAGSSGVGRLGGAHNSFKSYASGAYAMDGPIITTPLTAGHTIMMRGNGVDDPTTPDFDWSTYGEGYWTLPAGNGTSGMITIKGYNGRPLIYCNTLLIYQANYIRINHLKFKIYSVNYVGYAPITSTHIADDIIFDQNGNDCTGVYSVQTVNSWFKNTGSSAAGNYPAINVGPYGGLVANNFINGWEGPGITTAYMAKVTNNIIINTKNTTLGAIYAVNNSAGYMDSVNNNTIYGNAGNGIYVTYAQTVQQSSIYNNIISSNAGVGLKYAVGTSTWNDYSAGFHPDYNNFYENAGGNYLNISSGTHDTYLDPQFVSTTTYNFAIGTNLKAKGWPSTTPNTATNHYVDMGTAQRQESGAGSPVTTAFTFIGQ